MGAGATTDRIEAALRRLLDAPDLRRNAKRIAAEIADMPTTEDGVTALEQLTN
jgi:UDP:flavonoid glycosyltransferase YjiC (YdhE family)